jgi:hypothetical protein
MMKPGRRSRKLHRLLVPIAAAPLALTSLSGAIYGTIPSFKEHLKNPLKSIQIQD